MNEKGFYEVEVGEPRSSSLEEQATEEERIYANLVLKTDFEHEFIQEMLEFEPTEEALDFIYDLAAKRQQREQALQQIGMHPGGLGGGSDVIVA